MVKPPLARLLCPALLLELGQHIEALFPPSKCFMSAACVRGRPELLNRLDEVVVFRALGPADVRRIADLELAQVAARLAARGVRLEVAAAVHAQVCARGYDQVRRVRA